MRHARISLIASGFIVLCLLIWVWLGSRGVLDPSGASRSGPGKKSLVLYCAAGIKPPVEQICKDFESEFGVEVQIQYGGSGTLLSNLKVAGRGDLYLAADESYLLIAREEGLLREIIPLAHLTPVLAVQKGNPKQIKTLSDLLDPQIRVGLAHPEAAAVGRVSRALFTQADLWDRIKPAVKVFKPTVNELANDLKLGAIDVSLIWDATAHQYDELDTISLPAFETEQQLISIGILESSKDPTVALKLARYIGARDRGLIEFQKNGYKPVVGDVWEETPEVLLFSGGVNRVAIEDTLKQFEAREGCRVTRVYNGCGILVAQMKAGEKPDAYFACDISFMHNVGGLFYGSQVLSKTDMVILVPKGNPLNLKDLNDLASQKLKLGVANPQQSALGSLTEKLLMEAGVRDAVFANVKSQTPTADLLVNQLRTGSLDAAIVYRANTSQVTDSLDVIPINHPAAHAVQPYGVGRNSEHAQLMKRLEETLISSESQERFTSVGFEWMIPEKSDDE